MSNGFERPHCRKLPSGRRWPGALCDHRQLPGIGTQRQLFDGKLVGVSECSVPFRPVAFL